MRSPDWHRNCKHSCDIKSLTLTPKTKTMKTKTMALSLMLTFASCALFARNNNDTIPNDTTHPKKDTMPTAKATFRMMKKTNLVTFLKDQPADDQWMKNEGFYSFIPSKEIDLI
jgi:hypothetical protein